MRVLRVPGFALLLAGQSVNAIGNWVAIIAIWGFAAFEFDAGAGDLALLFVALSVPGALLGPLLGVPIDRLGPRRTLILANLLGFADALLLTQADSYEMFIILALPLGLIEALAAASLDALPPRLVDDEHLVSANALLSGSEDVAVVVGPLVAAVVNVHWGLSGAFLVDALTFLVGAAVALPLKVPPAVAHDDEERTTLGDLREGVSLARRTPGLRWTLGVLTLVYCTWALFGVLEPLYVRDVLEESDTMFALLQTVFGLGLVSGGLTVAALGDRLAGPRPVALSIAVSGGAAALYVGTEWLPAAFIGVAIWGVCIAFLYAPAKTLLQRYTPVAAHGRILSLNQSLEPMTDIVVSPLAALGVALIGVQALGVAGGATAAVVGLLALRMAQGLGPPPALAADEPARAPADSLSHKGPAPG